MHLVQRSRGGDSIALLDVGDEVSLGTWFETIQFLAAAVILGGLARSEACAAHLVNRVWVLAAVFLGLSIDESISLHERAGSILRDVFSTTGYLYYIWVIPAVAAALLLAVWQIPWLRSLPKKQRNGIVGAGALFVLCAGGLEILAAPGDEASGTEALRSIIFTAVEELGEMLAMSLFIAQVLSLLIGQRLTVRVTD